MNLCCAHWNLKRFFWLQKKIIPKKRTIQFIEFPPHILVKYLTKQHNRSHKNAMDGKVKIICINELIRHGCYYDTIEFNLLFGPTWKPMDYLGIFVLIDFFFSLLLLISFICGPHISSLDAFSCVLNKIQDSFYFVLYFLFRAFIRASVQTFDQQNTLFANICFLK